MSIAERCRDRGFDTTISFDDSPKHSKSYRQISSIPAKIPSRDASPSDIPNIHASISERRGKLKIAYFSGSISASPIIETIANDTTEYTATNIIPTTDGQSYTNKKLSLDSCRPSIDSSSPVSRIGSNAQCKSMKIVSVGSKNEPTNYRIMELDSSSFDFFKLLSSNEMFFQDHLLISSIDFSIILIILYKNGLIFNTAIQIQKLLFLFSPDYYYFHHIVSLVKSHYSLVFYYSTVYFLLLIDFIILLFILYSFIYSLFIYYFYLQLFYIGSCHNSSILTSLFISNRGIIISNAIYMT